MHIEIKTHDEFQEAHVTVKITADGQAEVETALDPGTLGRPAGQEDRIMDLEAANLNMANEIIRLRSELSRATSGHVCTDRCTENKHVAFIGRQRLIELEAELADERKNRKMSQEWAALAEARLNTVRDLVLRPPVDGAMKARGTAVLGDYSIIMGGTLAAIRELYLPRESADETSQA